MQKQELGAETMTESLEVLKLTSTQVEAPS